MQPVYVLEISRQECLFMENTIFENKTWMQLLDYAQTIKDQRIETFFTNPERINHFSVQTSHMLFDFSRQNLDEIGLNLLLKLATAADLKRKIEAMFLGEKINRTENRAVLHTALRNVFNEEVLWVDGVDVIADVRAVLNQVAAFTTEVHSGHRRGVTGKIFKNIVSIGIGGSYLGPEYVAEACQAFACDSRILRFVANVDGTDFVQKTCDLNPEETLFIIESKTFTTAETMKNAHSAKQWLQSRLPQADAIQKHFVAVSTNLKAVAEFGIDPANAFGFWDWVGGRFSVCSAIGALPLSLYFGYEIFIEFLRGAHNMDVHFRTEPFEKNIPVLAGLLALWNNNFLDRPAHAILPYSQALLKLAPHIQQVDMESNGKRVDLHGNAIPVRTGQVIFGEPGTNGQHSFYQLIHQGQVIPADFIGFIQPQYALGNASCSEVTHHQELMSNFFAQPDALAFGKHEKQLRKEGVSEALIPHKVFEGNRPSTSLLLDALTPFTTGYLLALYEHRTAVQGFIWNLNSFDQWGVELGKNLAKQSRESMVKHNGDSLEVATGYNASTEQLLNAFMQQSFPK